MKQEQKNLSIIEKAISDLPDDQREACNKLVDYMERAIRYAGSTVGTLALGLVVARIAAK